MNIKAKDSPVQVRQLRLEHLFPNPYQPESRHQVDEETAKKFGLSIMEHGLLQIPIVRHVLGDGATSQERVVNGHYEIGDGWLRLAGYRWLLASGHQEYDTMPVVLKELTDQQMADLVMEANTVRRDLTPLDLAKFYKRYLADFNITQAELARRHNCSQGEIANTIRLLELPEDVQGKIISREISEAHGRQLLRLNQAPKMQEEMVTQCGRRNYSVSELSNEIESELWYGSKSLNPEAESYSRPAFDISACQDCQFKIRAAQPYGSKKKEDRCLNAECWERKNAEAIQLQVKEAWEKMKAEGKDEKLVTGDQIHYSDYEYLDLEDVDNPEECETCEKTALYKYSITDFGAARRICLDPACYRRKKIKKTRDTNKLKKEQDRELTIKLGQTFRHAHENPRGCLQILARHIIPMLSAEGRQDIAWMFEVPMLNNGRLDIDALKISLKDKTLDDLFQLAVGAIFIKMRRDAAYGNFSIELKDEQKRDLAILNNTLDEYLAEVIAFQEANCRGCRYARENLVGTGEECCTMTYYKRLDSTGKCTGRAGETTEEPAEEETVEAVETSGAPEAIPEVEKEEEQSGEGEHFLEPEVQEEKEASNPQAAIFMNKGVNVLEMPQEEFAAAANARFEKFVKCSWCRKKFLGSFEHDKDIGDKEHWRAECPECGGITYISNRRWDGMAGIRKEKEKPGGESA